LELESLILPPEREVLNIDIDFKHWEKGLILPPKLMRSRVMVDKRVILSRGTCKGLLEDAGSVPELQRAREVGGVEIPGAAQDSSKRGGRLPKKILNFQFGHPKQERLGGRGATRGENIWCGGERGE